MAEEYLLVNTAETLRKAQSALRLATDTGDIQLACSAESVMSALVLGLKYKMFRVPPALKPHLDRIDHL